MSLFSIFSKKPSEPTSVAEALAGTGSAAGAGASSTKSRSRKSETRRAEEDEQLVPEKKRARRRLIGAVAIVLAIAIGLPMLLDSEPRPVNKNIAIQMGGHDEPAIESKDDVAQEDVQPAVTKPAVAPKAEAPAAVDSTPTAPANNRQVVETKPQVAPPPAAAPAAPAASAATKSKPDLAVDAKTTKHDTKASKASKDSDKATSSDDARALALLNGSDTSAKPGQIVVQVGAFATQEKVNELQGKLSAAGIQSFTRKVPTSAGDVIRVRVGPFADKTSATKMKSQLEKLGLNPTLITL